MFDPHEIAQHSRASQDKWELEELLKLIHLFSNPRIVEIGIDQGYSLDVWNEAFAPQELIGIDVRAAQRPLPYTILLSEKGSQDPYIQRLVNNEKETDFLFIDGSHTYENVKSDFLHYAHFGKCIAFHDVCYHADGTEEVDVFWKELQDKYTDRAITIHNPSGQGTGVGLLYL